ncbi:MAG: helix-turn-helix domain-containing protein [Lachnospiraceae bacterium]|nr:helix-turn-helix domain-containing protein [Lachnospiraceae bacterium]
MTLKERIKKVKDNYPEVMTRQQVADAIGSCLSIVDKLNKSGEIPYTKKVEKRLRYYEIKRSDVIEYLKDRYLHEDKDYTDSTIEFLTKYFENEPDLLGVRDVMRIAGVGKTAATKWINEGRIRGFCIYRYLKVRKADLLAYMASSLYQDIRIKNDVVRKIISLSEEYYYQNHGGKEVWQ